MHNEPCFHHIHLCSVDPTQGHPGVYSSGLGEHNKGHDGQGAHPSHTLTDQFTHYEKFRDAEKPIRHVLGLVKETGVPGRNP